MTDKTIVNARTIGGDYFTLIYSRKSEYKLDHYLNMFNTDDYYIFKTTNKQRLVSIEDMKEFKYSGYTFFKKELYDVNNILHWIDYLLFYKMCSHSSGLNYLSKPFPPFRPEDKIEIRK